MYLWLQSMCTCDVAGSSSNRAYRRWKGQCGVGRPLFCVCLQVETGALSGSRRGE